MGAIKQARQKLPLGAARCLYCQAETPHDTVRIGFARFRWFGPPSRRSRTVDVCRQCGNYTFQPDRIVLRPAKRTAINAGR